jgi:hypothetical protein
MITVSVNYIVVWEIPNTPYKFTQEGICINCQRCKILKKVSKNGAIGYNLNSKFYPLKKVRLMLKKIENNKIPF